jgi:hypothetical protein
MRPPRMCAVPSVPTSSRSNTRPDTPRRRTRTSNSCPTSRGRALDSREDSDGRQRLGPVRVGRVVVGGRAVRGGTRFEIIYLARRTPRDRRPARRLRCSARARRRALRRSPRRGTRPRETFTFNSLPDAGRTRATPSCSAAPWPSEVEAGRALRARARRVERACAREHLSRAERAVGVEREVAFAQHRGNVRARLVAARPSASRNERMYSRPRC